MKTLVFTQQEIWNAMKHKVVKSKKVYSRKNKHKKLAYLNYYVYLYTNQLKLLQ